MNRNNETPAVPLGCLGCFLFLLFAVALVVFVLVAVLLVLVSLGLVAYVVACLMSGFLWVALVCMAFLCLYLLFPRLWLLLLFIFRKCRENRLLREHGLFIIYILVLAVATFMVCLCGEQSHAPAGERQHSIRFSGYVEIGAKEESSKVNRQIPGKGEGQWSTSGQGGPQDKECNVRHK